MSKFKKSQIKLLKMRDKYHILQLFDLVSYFNFDEDGRELAGLNNIECLSLKIHDYISPVRKQKNNIKTAVYNFEIESDFEAVKELQSEIYNILPNSVSNDIFAMGLHELVVNAVEHGNNLQQEKKVYIEILFNEEYSYAVIEDQGSGFNWREKLNKDFKLDKAGERGRGIMMTYRGCDNFFYNNKGNKAYILKLNDF